MHKTQIHFPEDMWETTPSGNRRLISTAVPSIFPLEHIDLPEPSARTPKKKANLPFTKSILKNNAITESTNSNSGAANVPGVRPGNKKSMIIFRKMAYS